MIRDAPVLIARPAIEDGLSVHEADTVAVCSKCGHGYAYCAQTGSQICEYCLFGLALGSVAPEPASITAEPVICPVPAHRIGNYVLLEEIGRGGMGVIYRAVHQQTNAVVALKTVLPDDTGCAEVLERFQREAIAAQSLDHPHSMPIYEVGCSDAGVPFFSMRLAEGGSLFDLKAKYVGRWRQIAELMVKIADAVHHAHVRGILHRDLKPGNILFTEEHEPLVTDFGLVKLLAGSDALTRSHAILGTPSYVSPEQAAGKTRELTVAADVYSLGAILFELLTGRPPFVGDNALEVLQLVIGKAPTRARRLAPTVPKALDAICMRCLDRRPTDRYVSAQDLARDLKNWLQGREIESRPIYTRLQSNLRRHPTIYAWCTGLFCVALALCMVWTLSKRSQFNAEHMVSIAVAIDNPGEDPSLVEVSRDVTSGLQTELSSARVFRVFSRDDLIPATPTEIFDPLKYGHRANAELLLTGSVRYSSNQLRIITRLLRCDTGDVIWRNTTTIPSEAVTRGLQASTKAIVDSLQKSWSTQPKSSPSLSVKASDARAFYAKAMDLTVRQNRRDLDAAIKLLQEACELDPHYAQARAMLAYGFLTTANSYGDTSVIPLAISTAKEALADDPDSAPAHRVMAACYFKEGRCEEALSECWQGVELDPQSPGCAQALGVCLREMGHPERAIPWLSRAARLAPSRGAFSASLGETLILCGFDQDAEVALKRAAELDPDRWDAPIDLCALRTWQKRFGEARQLCADANKRFPENRYGSTLAAWIDLCDGKIQDAKSKYEILRRENTYQLNWEFFGAVNPSSALAYVALRDGAKEQAHLFAQEAFAIDSALLEKAPHNPRILHDLAATYAVIGNLEKAQDYLNQAVAAGWVEQRSTQIDPRFSAIAESAYFRDSGSSTFPLAVVKTNPAATGRK